MTYMFILKCALKLVLKNILHDMILSSVIIRLNKSLRMKWEGYISHTREIINTYRIMIGKPQEETPIQRLKIIWGV